MPLSVRLTNEEEALLDAAARQTARSRSALVRQAVRELCQRLVRADKTPYVLRRNRGQTTFSVEMRIEMRLQAADGFSAGASPTAPMEMSRGA